MSKLPHTRQVLRNRNTPLTWIILAASALLFIPSMILDRVWMDLQEVRVADADDAYAVDLLVDRDVHRNFYGMYDVSIYRTDGEFICRGTPISPYYYRTETVLPRPMPLSRWIGGYNNLNSCIENGLDEGEFLINSCTSVFATVWDIPIARRCLESNTFKITPAVSAE